MSYAEKAKSQCKERVSRTGNQENFYGFQSSNSRSQTYRKGSEIKVRKPFHNGSSFKKNIASVSSNHLNVSEHDDPKFPVKTEETTEDKQRRIRKRLETFASPFIWRPKQNSKKHFSQLQEKDEEIKDDKRFKWRNFILQLVISYETYKMNNLNEAMEKVRALQKTLIQLEDCQERLFVGIKDALLHVVNTSKAFLLLESNLLNDVEKLLDEIMPVRFMKRESQAGILGIEAAVFMEYGHEGNKRALTKTMQALDANSKEPEWHFLLGKCMGRIRRVSKCHDEVPWEEVKAISYARKMDPTNPSYLVFLAQAIREHAFRLYKKTYPPFGSEDYKKIKKKLFAAQCKYREARDMRPDCPHMLVRCAFGLTKMPSDLVDLKLVRECLDKALELAPNNSMVHHVNALYYERFHVDSDKALSAMKQAADLGNFGAAMDLVRVHFKLNKKNILEELQVVAETFKYEPCSAQVAYMNAGSYLLFIKKSFIDALTYYLKVLEIEPSSELPYAMKSHKPIFIRMKDPINMLNVLLEELDSNTDWNSFEDEDKIFLRKARIRISRFDSGEKKERLTVEKILEMERQLVEKDRKYKEKMAHQKPRKKWYGKSKSSGNNENKPTSSRKNHRNKKKGSFNKKENNIRQKRCSSISSVDSDYEREKNIYELKEFPLDDFKTNNESKQNLLSDPFDRSTQNFSNKLSITRNKFSSEGRCQSRDSSISSSYSIDVDLGGGKMSHTSRYSLSHPSSWTKKGNSLTIENVEAFDSMNSNCTRLRGMSITSLTSVDTRSNTSLESLSVMDRVKQSYKMLDYNKNDKSKNTHRSSSLNQNVKSWGNKKSKSDSKSEFPRSQSSQELNVNQSSVCGKRFSGAYKPSFSSRDSSLDSSRSFSFMPTFAIKKSESEGDN